MFLTLKLSVIHPLRHRLWTLHSYSRKYIVTEHYQEPQSEKEIFCVCTLLRTNFYFKLPREHLNRGTYENAAANYGHISTPGTTTAVSQAYNPTRQHLLAQVDEHREGGAAAEGLRAAAFPGPARTRRRRRPGNRRRKSAAGEKLPCFREGGPPLAWRGGKGGGSRGEDLGWSASGRRWR